MHCWKFGFYKQREKSQSSPFCFILFHAVTSEYWLSHFSAGRGARLTDCIWSRKPLRWRLKLFIQRTHTQTGLPDALGRPWEVDPRWDGCADSRDISALLPLHCDTALCEYDFRHVRPAVLIPSHS